MTIFFSKHSSLFAVLVTLLFLAAGCSYLDMADEGQSFISDQSYDGNLSGVKEESYYFFDEKIEYQTCPDMVFVQFFDNKGRDSFLSGLQGVSSLQVYEPLNSKREADSPYSVTVLKSLTGEITEEQLSQLQEDDRVKFYSIPAMSGDKVYSVMDDFSVKLKDMSMFQSLSDMVVKYGCEIYTREGFGDDIFFIRIPKSARLSSLNLSRVFYESGLFDFASPDFFHFNIFASVDLGFAYQWNLKNIGQRGYVSGLDIKVEQAWQITEGSEDIKVAVVDDGILTTHFDLAGNVGSGYNVFTNSTVTTYYGGEHGTAVAGVISAKKDNQIGISGAAPKCKVLPIIAYVNETSNDIAAGINAAYLQGADVINCSITTGVYSALVSDAIYNAVTLGRSGKGSVVVFSSGNSYNSNEQVQYPATDASVISVGAISGDGKRKLKTFYDASNRLWSSCYGNQLDVVAPGVYIPSLTVANGIDYNFYGTSLAAPHVAGVAALILSKYPDLTYKQVMRAIELGCTKLSSYVYSQDGEYPAGTRNNEVGYGLVNAYGSLQQAATLHQLNIHNSISGFDFVIRNRSSYWVDDIYIEVSGRIGSQLTTLIDSDPGGVYSGSVVGYPFYFGEDVYAPAGSAISNIALSFSASSPDYSGYLRIGASIDNPTPLHYSSVIFDDGNTCTISLPNTTVPDQSRRTIYIDILNNY